MANVMRWKPLREVMRNSLKLEPLVGDWADLEEGYCSSPALESYASKEEYLVRVDLPGVDPKDVRLTFEGSYLRIEGVRRRGTEPERGWLVREEVCYGPFRRTLHMPGEIKGEEVSARYREGVLEVSAPIEIPADVSLPQRIEVVEESLPQRIIVEEANS